MTVPTATRLQVKINPQLVRWARERVSWELTDQAALRFPKLSEWERGTAAPTFRQLEKYAQATHTPIGYFFLPEPPEERMPIPDLRTIGSRPIERASPDLLDTIYICQLRQEWYRDFAQSQGAKSLSFVGSANLTSDVVETAALMRDALGFDIDERRRTPTWTEALRHFIAQTDELGVLVMVSGVVGNNNYRKLDPDEFRGFALSDAWSPLVFINGADSKAAQMFTLAHELAHIWLGQSALSDAELGSTPTNGTERWCNQVAAELLVPLEALSQAYRAHETLALELERLARHFKVSTLVILRRIFDVGALTRKQFTQSYNAELERLRALPSGGGGNFYLTQGARLGKRFARAVVGSTLEGQTLYREAFHLLGFSKVSTLLELAQKLGIG
jgi:Zn-dependent peptidase ImmA (M78 family)/transcriptional regulator with XRE-family HTH domain